MGSVKFLIFAIGIFLANFVGGVPEDSRNLFITHTIFFAPYLVDYYLLTKVKSGLKWIIIIIWGVGIFVFVANILGIVTILTIKEYNVVINPDYYSPFNVSIPVNIYLLLAGSAYMAIFMGCLCFKYLEDLNERLLAKKELKREEKAKKQDSREEMVKNVST